MARHYQPKKFFRQAPNKLLKEYFRQRGILTEIDFSELGETQVEPIYGAWLKLPGDKINEMEQEFREIDALATEGGVKAIIDEAHFHGEALEEKFIKMKAYHEQTFWTFMNRNKYWIGALHFNYADSIAQSYWRKRKNLHRVAAHVDEDNVQQLEATLKKYFYKEQGRGRNCKIECYRRKNMDYFFAYPEDYTLASIEWERSNFQRKTRHPAFEVIFVYSQEEGTLDIFLAGDKKPVPDLQNIFAKIILKTQLLDDQSDERVYNLNPLKSRDFQFVYNSDSGIENVFLKKLRLSLLSGRSQRIILEADPTENPEAVYDLLDKINESIPSSTCNITQARIQIKFVDHPSSRGGRSRTFNISWPNSCNLK